MSDVFDFGKPINDVKGLSIGSGGASKYPAPGGYVFKCVGSAITKSSKGTPQWELKFDIAEGDFKGCFSKYPKMMWQNLSTDVGKGIAKTIIQTFIGDNPGIISNSMLSGSSFDPSSVIGLSIGGVLVADGKFTKLDTLCRIDVAKGIVSVEKKAADKPATVEENGLPF